MDVEIIIATEESEAGRETLPLGDEDSQCTGKTILSMEPLQASTIQLDDVAVSPTGCSQYGDEVLLISSRLEDPPEVLVGAIGRGDVSSPMPSGETGLTAAMLGGHDDIFHLLLDVGADPNVRSRAGRLPLELAVVKRYPVQWVERLLAKNASPSVSDTGSGRSLLQCAWLQGSLELVQLLMTHGADPKLLPVELVLTTPDTQWLEMMLDAGASPEVEGQRSGLNILQLACLHGREDLVQLLLNRGVNVDGPAGSPRTARPLRLAMELQDEALRGRLADLLLQHRARVDAPDVYRYSPIFFACVQGDLDLVGRFLHHCPKPSTPVHPVEAFILLGHCSKAAALVKSHPVPLRQLLWAALCVQCSRCLRLCLDNGVDLDFLPTTTLIKQEYYTFILHKARGPYGLIDYAMADCQVAFEGFGHSLLKSGYDTEEIYALVIRANFSLKQFVQKTNSDAVHTFHNLLQKGYLQACHAFCLAGYIPVNFDYDMPRRTAPQSEQTLQVAHLQEVTTLPRTLLMSAVHVRRNQLCGNIIYKANQLKIPIALKSLITLDTWT